MKLTTIILALVCTLGCTKSYQGAPVSATHIPDVAGAKVNGTILDTTTSPASQKIVTSVSCGDGDLDISSGALNGDNPWAIVRLFNDEYREEKKNEGSVFTQLAAIFKGTSAGGMLELRNHANRNQAILRISPNTSFARSSPAADETVMGINYTFDFDHKRSGMVVCHVRESVKYIPPPPPITDDCGLTGSVDERMQNCALVYGAIATKSLGGGWSLVSRQKDVKVWKDLRTGLIWSETLTSRYISDNYTGCVPGKFMGTENYRAVYQKCPVAQKLDQETGNVVEETACQSEEGKRAQAGITDKPFVLPSIADFRQADNDFFETVYSPPGIRIVTEYLAAARGAYTFFYGGGISKEAKFAAVRCVAK